MKNVLYKFHCSPPRKLNDRDTRILAKKIPKISVSQRMKASAMARDKKEPHARIIL